MALLKAVCWALIFILRIRFLRGRSLVTIENLIIQLQELPFDFHQYCEVRFYTESDFHESNQILPQKRKLVNCQWCEQKLTF